MNAGCATGRECPSDLPLRRQHRRSRGQAFAEFMIAATLMAVLFAAILEVGRAWSAIELLTAAVREGARVASITPTADRQSATITAVRDVASTLFAPGTVSVVVTETMEGGTQPVVTVRARASIELLFGNLLPVGTVVDGTRVLPVTRTATLRDETIAGS